MAISGYSSVNSSNNIPFNNDAGQKLNPGDMLFWNTTYQAFEARPGITKLSHLANDLGYTTEEQVLNIVAALQTGGTLDLSMYATDAEVKSAITTEINKLSLFSGNYNDLTNKPVLFSGSYNDLTGRPQLFSGFYGDLREKPDLSQYVTFNQVNSIIANIDYSNFVTDSELSVALSNISSTGNVDLTNYYTKSEVDTAISSAVLNGVDLSGYITDQELAVALSNYQPTIDLSNYVTIAALNTALSNYQPTIDLSNYITTASLNTVLSNYQTKIDLSNYALKTELFSGNYNDLINKPTIPDVSGFASVTYVDNQIASALTGGTIDLSSYVTESELATALSNYQPTVDLSNYALKTELFSGDYNDLINKPIIPDVSGFVTTSALTSTLTTYYTRTQIDNLLDNISTGNVDLTGYATQTYVNQQIANASVGGIASINDLNDVAIGSLPTVENADDFYLLEYNPITKLWESKNFGGVFATEAYVSATVATALTSGTINLDGYATEQYVEQKLLERGDHFSGDYNDLQNTPILFSGDYRDLINTPADNSDLRLVLQNDELRLMNIEPEPDTIISAIPLDDLGAAVSSYIDYNQVNNLPNIFSGNYNDLINRPRLFSGNYNDLSNKPYIPSIAGLATVNYVDNRWAEPVITGDRTFTGSIIFEDFVQQKLSTVNSTSTKRELVLAVQTANDIETEVLFSDASRVGIVAGTTAMFKATVVASSGADKTAFIVKGVIDYTGTLSIVGNNIVETISDSDLGWAANLTADTVNEALKITVTGSAATVVDWTVFLEISEVIR